MQVTVAGIVSGVAGVLALAVAAVAWRYRDRPGGDALVAFNVGVAIWSLGNALQASATTLAGKLLWVNVQYVGIAFIPAATYVFACEYTGHETWAKPARVALVATPLAVLAVLSWTNGLHGLVRSSATLSTVGGDVRLVREFGAAFWVGWLYSALVNSVSAVLLLYWLLRQHRTYLRQAAVVAVGVTVPWLAHVLFLAGALPVDPEVTFVVTGAAFLYVVHRESFLELVPVARAHVFETVDDAVVVLDDDGQIVDANTAAGELLGVDTAEAVGSDADDAFEEVPALGDVVESGTDHGTVTTADEGRHFDVKRSPIDGRGEVFVFRDVTPLKRRERRLEERNERLRRVGDTIAHDLRNPLSVANGYLELATESAEGEVESHLEHVESAHERIGTIVDDVLAAARAGESVATSQVRLDQIADRAWASVDTDGTTMTVDALEVEADPERLQRLLENLFRNCVDHGADDAGNVAVRVGALADGAGFYVADDGPGIPPEDREDVLEYGYTGANTGTGLGLAIVRDIAVEHGWEVSVTESDAGGARFEFGGVDIAATSGA